MSRENIATIDCAALRHNLSVVKQFAPHQKILAMVKANAYGHGIIPVARALSNADALGVACLEEAMRLRDAGIQTPLVMMAGFFQAHELAIIAEHHIAIVVQNDWQLGILEGAHPQQAISVWLKINTGMNRLGFNQNEFREKLARLQALPFVKQIGLMSHLSDADQLTHEKSHHQIDLFHTLSRDFVGPRSLANSAAILAWPKAHLDWVRPGVMLYGISPFANEAGYQRGLKAVMSLSSRVIALHHCQAGDAVGYGSQFICDAPTRIAVVCMGYGDGYPWHAKTGTPVMIQGVVCHLAGRVSMDMLTVVVPQTLSVQVGDPVLLWGPQLPVEEVARHAGTISYELISKLTERVRFQVIHADETACSTV